jgi:hypothetical protein
MGFKSNIDYGAYERIKQRGDEGLTRAKYVKKKEDEAEARRAAAEAAAAATRRSGQRSGLQKLGSAALRAGAAYYTGGASEALGFGGAIDDVVLGKDDQGNSIQNEYGEIVRAGSGIYGAMKGKKAGDVARKRGSNISDYNEQVALAKDMGVFDPVLGKDMLQQARDTRYAQKAQTQAGEDASVWGWDNEFDDLELSPAQIAGGEEADDRINRRGRDGTTSVTVPDFQKEGSDSRIRLENEEADRINMANQGPSMAEVEAMYERDKKQSFMDNPDLDSPMTPSTRLNKRYDKARMMDEMMDQEYNKGLLDERGASFGRRGSGISDAELEANNAGRNALVEAQNKQTFAPLPTYKTYSEKEAEKLNRNDGDKLRAGTLDDIAFDSKGRALGKRDGFLRFADRLIDPKQGREDEQHYQEFLLRQKAALARERARTGGPYGGEWLKRGQRPESTLLKRIRAERKADSILHR